MSIYSNQVEWKCPHCGSTTLELTTEQAWLTEMEIYRGIGQAPWANYMVNNQPEIVQILCLECNADDDNIEEWCKHKHV